jgi:hypothetical protein
LLYCLVSPLGILVIWNKRIAYGVENAIFWAVFHPIIAFIPNRETGLNAKAQRKHKYIDAGAALAANNATCFINYKVILVSGVVCGKY